MTGSNQPDIRPEDHNDDGKVGKEISRAEKRRGITDLESVDRAGIKRKQEGIYGKQKRHRPQEITRKVTRSDDTGQKSKQPHNNADAGAPQKRLSQNDIRCGENFDSRAIRLHRKICRQQQRNPDTGRSQ